MIPRATLYDRAALSAERVIREHNITSLPVDPIAIAISLGIEVVAKPTSDGGVSGMLIRYGEQFCIAYATHVKSQGFRRFTIAHELGHYFLEGHVDAIFRERSVHKSRAGFVSSIPYELEADHFAARLLMPNALFSAALRRAGEGLAAVESLESVRKHHAGWLSFRNMRRMEARRRKASDLGLRHTQSLASLRQRPSQARVRSTIQRLGRVTKPLA